MSHPHAFFLEQSKLDQIKAQSWILDPNETQIRKHIKALRLKSGDHVFFLDGSGTKLLAKLVDTKNFEFEFINTIISKKQSPHISVALSPPKSSDLDLCLQICTELEVSDIYLFKSQHNDHNKALNLGRLKQISKTSCEQSLNAWSPNIYNCMNLSLSDFLEQKSKESFQKIWFDEDLSELRPKMFSMEPQYTDAPHLIFIGPEGGWSNQERQTFSSHKIPSKSLGPLVLKVPTALCCAIAVMRSCYEK